MAYAFASASSQSITAATPITTYPFTVACWARPANTTESMTAWSIHKGIGYNTRWVNGLSSGTTNFVVRDENNLIDGKSGDSSIGSTYAANEWIQTSAKGASSTSRQIYHNGTAGTLATGNWTPPGVLTLALGVSVANELYYISYLNGNLAEVGIWNVALTADEIASLAKGFKPTRIRPQSLVFYAPLVRDLQDVRKSITLTNNNTATVADHPRVY